MRPCTSTRSCEGRGIRERPVGGPRCPALYACFILLACGQFAHALLSTKRADRAPLSCVYEFSLVAQMLVCVAVVQLSVTGNASGFVHILGLYAPPEALLHASTLCAVLAVIVAVRAHRPAAGMDAVLLASCTPPVAGALGDAYVYPFIAEAGFFLYRTASGLIDDSIALGRQPSPLSCVDALDVLPEGVLYADGHGRVAFMNDRMRSCLHELGAPVDLSSADDIAAFIVQAGRGLRGNETGAAPEDPYEALRRLRVIMPKGSALLFDVVHVSLGARPCRCVTAADVTEEESLNRAIAHNNDLLATANRELAASLADVRAVARADAVRKMRSRVHDTIGQKLSILHRYLEKSDPSAAELAQVKELLRDITHDIAVADEVDPVAELASIVDAFSLVGCALVVKGTLPRERRLARAVVDIVRESATNAVKHGQAARVDVAISLTSEACTLTVSNNGAPAPSHLTEGLGVPGMRAAAEEVGGTFEVVSTSPFSLRARLPLSPRDARDHSLDPKEASHDSHPHR